MIEFPYQQPYPMGGTNGEPEPRVKHRGTLQHVEIKDGYYVTTCSNCPACEVSCPIREDGRCTGADGCFYGKEGLCDYPYSKE